MYDDFPTIYETSLNQNLIYFIILGIILLILLIITLISLAKIFKKANRSGISAFIPIYNLIMLLEITNSSKWYLLFLLIPGVNIIFSLSIMFSLAKNFRKSRVFALGLTFLPFIFFPILAFGNSEYIGINLVAMEGKSIVADIPKVIEPEEKAPLVHEETDTASKNLNISIGGGVYQKDYTNTLLQVDQNQAILNKNTGFIDNSSSIQKRPLNDNIDSSKLSFLAPIEEPKIVEEELKDISTNFAEQMNSITEQKIEAQPEPPKEVPSIFVPNNMNSINNNQPLINQTPLDQNPQEEVSFTINPEVQALTDNQLREKSEFISCPKCGAKVKSDAKICFLCGRRLD